MRTSTVITLAALALVSCKKETATEPAVHAAVAVDAGVGVPLTFLVTGAENGYLLPTAGTDGAHGGAAEVLARFVADGHCAGPLGENGQGACADAGTLVLSTGDNANGAAISSFFRGESTAEVMHHMGYAASAFGNRELDWAKDQFLANVKKANFPYLAANLEAASDEGKGLNLQAFRVLERRGVKVGVIGLAARKATVTPMPGRMAGLGLITEEAALTKAVPAARAAGAQVLAIITDGCLNEVPEVLSAHPDWAISFVAGRDCGAPWPAMVGATALVYPGRHFNSYARVALQVYPTKAPTERVAGLTVTQVDVVQTPQAPSAEPEAKKIIDGWKQKLDAALGETIGFSKTGLEQEAPLMAQWLTTSLKEQFKTDVALLNRKGVRQALPAGPITKASIWDLAPFENEILIVRITGAQLKAALSNIEARAAGVREKGESFVDAKGAPLDDAKVYTVATSDYLYLGGDGFKLNEADKAPVATKTSWQTALIEWTKSKKSDEKQPLESLLKKP